MEGFDAIKYINAPSWQKSRLGLDRIRKLLNLLGDPQKKLKFIHVAGTNGKGSTCAYISQIFIEAGYITGQFTSPYIYQFSERIRVNNVKIPDEHLKIITLKVKEVADTFPVEDHPTEFELMTAVAFLYFYEQQCDIVVCEVGMGGRLDSTNVLEPKNVCATVITPIDMDHMQFLGDTIFKIASEKAGIIKEGVPCITALPHPDTTKAVHDVARSKNCKIRTVNPYVVHLDKVDLSSQNLVRKFVYKNYDNLETSLLAIYQPFNAALAIEVAEELKHDFPNINEATIYYGIKNTIWPARFEIVKRNPYVILDGGHNTQGVEVLVSSLKDIFENEKFIFIMGVLSDKDYLSMIKKIIPITKKVYTITPPNPRNLPAEYLAKCFLSEGVEAVSVEISNAIDIASKDASPDDVVVAFGSLYSVSSLI